jgi:hypothetical protein
LIFGRAELSAASIILIALHELAFESPGNVELKAFRSCDGASVLSPEGRARL